VVSLVPVAGIFTGGGKLFSRLKKMSALIAKLQGKAQAPLRKLIEFLTSELSRLGRGPDALKSFFSRLRRQLEETTAELRKLKAQRVTPKLGRLLEEKAKALVRKRFGETVIESQYKLGIEGLGFDFLSFTGRGKNVKLFINEVKDFSGKVPQTKFTMFGMGERGSRAFDDAMAAARKAIANTSLDSATKEALLDQLNSKGAAGAKIRLIGSEAKGTIFDPDINDLIGETTERIVGERFLLP
jgi:hypothetical protein